MIQRKFLDIKGYIDEFDKAFRRVSKYLFIYHLNSTTRELRIINGYAVLEVKVSSCRGAFGLEVKSEI